MIIANEFLEKGMSEAGKNEEIIDLTEVVEEGPGEPGMEPKEMEVAGSIEEPPLEELPILGREGEHFPEMEDKTPALSPGVPEPRRPLFPDQELDVRALKETLTAKVQEWVVSEGAQVLERVAREIFPKIAEEVLRKEIEKLKGEAEEKE